MICMLSSLSNNVKIIDGNKVSLSRDNSGTLRLKIEGEAEDYPIRPIRYFPFTEEKVCYVGLFAVASDGTVGREIAFITDLKKLSDDSRRLLEEELDKFFPLVTIKKIVSIRQIGGKLSWEVITDKGVKVFKLVKQQLLTPSILYVKDGKGRKYKVDLAMLDSKSQLLLENCI